MGIQQILNIKSPATYHSIIGMFWDRRSHYFYHPPHPPHSDKVQGGGCMLELLCTSVCMSGLCPEDSFESLNLL